MTINNRVRRFLAILCAVVLASAFFPPVIPTVEAANRRFITEITVVLGEDAAGQLETDG